MGPGSSCHARRRRDVSIFSSGLLRPSELYAMLGGDRIRVQSSRRVGVKDTGGQSTLCDQHEQDAGHVGGSSGYWREAQ